MSAVAVAEIEVTLDRSLEREMQGKGAGGSCLTLFLGRSGQLSVFVRRLPQCSYLCRVSSSHGKENRLLCFQREGAAPCQAVQARSESGLPSELSSLTPLSKPKES